MKTEHRAYFVICGLFFALAALAVFVGGESVVRAAHHPRSLTTIGFFWSILGIYGFLVEPHALTRRAGLVLLSLGLFQLFFGRLVAPATTPSVTLSGSLLVLLAAVFVGIPLIDRLTQKSQNSVWSDTRPNA